MRWLGHSVCERYWAGAYLVVVYTTKDGELVVLALRVAHRSYVYRNL